tara:strand:+ start:1897 stop:2661 length:765 start_codon:yes stop_codon:yes gene_type:complete
MEAHSQRIQALSAYSNDIATFIVTNFHSNEFTISKKTDGSEVTNIDIEAELLAKDSILEAFPSDGFLGEENGEMRGTSGYRWIIDPIDGTASFARGVPLFGTLLGLEFEGKPIAGIANLPAIDEVISAVIGQGSLHQNKMIAHVSETELLQDAMICTTSFDYFKQTNSESIYANLLDCGSSLRGWSDCFAYLLLCTGRIDAVVEPLLHPWDIVPWLPIIAESGGKYSEIAMGGVASNAIIHDTLYHALHDDITN